VGYVEEVCGSEMLWCRGVHVTYVLCRNITANSGEGALRVLYTWTDGVVVVLLLEFQDFQVLLESWNVVRQFRRRNLLGTLQNFKPF